MNHRIIYELAGFLSTQDAFKNMHPEEIVPLSKDILNLLNYLGYIKTPELSSVAAEMEKYNV